MPASMRVKDAAEAVLTCIIDQVVSTHFTYLSCQVNGKWSDVSLSAVTEQIYICIAIVTLTPEQHYFVINGYS